MLIFSHKLFLKKFLSTFHEASDKPFQKMNRNLEVTISFLSYTPVNTNIIPLYGENTKIPFLKLLK